MYDYLNKYLFRKHLYLIFIPLFFFFFNDTATTEIYTLSLHDALPISSPPWPRRVRNLGPSFSGNRSEEHTSELQSQSNLVCRLLLEKKKKTNSHTHTTKKKKPTQSLHNNQQHT